MFSKLENCFWFSKIVSLNKPFISRKHPIIIFILDLSSSLYVNYQPRMAHKHCRKSLNSQHALYLSSTWASPESFSMWAKLSAQPNHLKSPFLQPSLQIQAQWISSHLTTKHLDVTAINSRTCEGLLLHLLAREDVIFQLYNLFYGSLSPEKRMETLEPQSWLSTIIYICLCSLY